MYWTKDVEYGDVRQEKKGSEHKKIHECSEGRYTEDGVTEQDAKDRVT